MPNKLQVVCAVIFDSSKQRVLVAKKKFGKPNAGLWEFPGGKIEFGETPKQALEREIDEELARKIEIQQFLGTFSHQSGKVEIELNAYICQFCPLCDELPNSLDHDEIRWIDSTKSELAWSEADLEIFNQIFKH